MSNFVIVGRRVIPPEHIALVEPYDPSANPKFQTTRDFKGRVVMVNRDSILIEETPQAFAEANGFRMLAADRVAANPVIHFRVESFLPADGFRPAKPYASRILWRDLDGNDQSKLLLSEPETVAAVVVRGEADTTGSPVARPRRARRPRAEAAAKAHVS